MSVTDIPFKEDLRNTDERHDRFGKVIYLVTETVFVYPALHAMEASGRGHEKLEREDDAAPGSVAEAKPA